MFDLGQDLEDVDLSVFNDILETPGFGDSPSAALNGRINIHYN